MAPPGYDPGGERVDPVKDAGQRAAKRTPVADNALWLTPAQPVLYILDRLAPASPIMLGR